MNPRHGLGHDPGVGKTPIVCMLAAIRWEEEGCRTVWVQPNSLRDKNADELLEFTEFKREDIVILDEDHAQLTKKWTGPVITRTKVLRGTVVIREDTGETTDTVQLRDEVVFERFEGHADPKQHGTGGYRKFRGRKPPLDRPPEAVIVRVVPDAPPKIYDLEEDAADLIAEAAKGGAKVILCGFRFFTLHWKRILAAFPSINQLMIDECHKSYSTNDSEATLALYEAMRQIKYFAPMTGTLVNGRLDSVFPVIHLIEPRYYGSYDGFLAQHAGYIDNYNKVTEWINVEKVTEIKRRHFTKRTFEETYGKEAVVFFYEEVEMLPAHREKYDEFHHLAMLELEDGRVLDGALPGVATIRARQIMAHPEFFGLKLEGQTSKDERIDLHARAAGPMVVFSAHVPEQERLVKLLRAAGRKVGLLNGSVTGMARARVDLDFRSGALDTIVCSEEVASCGFNWGIAELILFVSLTYQDTGFVQAYRRGLRGLRSKPLRVVTLAYKNSIDQRAMDIMIEKSQLANQVDADRQILTFGRLP